MTETTALADLELESPVEIITGGCAVRALPATDVCAITARSFTREALQRLIPADRVDDCCVMVSELATNALQHAGGGSELAIYRRGPAERCELVITIFDPDPNVEAVPTPAPFALAATSDIPLGEPLSPAVQDAVLDSLPAALDGTSLGHGLDLVATLSHGRFGFYRTRSRRRQDVSGKAAWVAVPAAPDSLVVKPPPLAVRSPDDAIRVLKKHAEARGLPGYHITGRKGAFLSLKHLSVWCPDGQSFRWGVGRQAVQLPCYDLVEAVEQIIKVHEDVSYVNRGAFRPHRPPTPRPHQPALSLVERALREYR